MNRNGMGYLLVNVRYANGASPVFGGRVSLQRDGSEFGEFFTDEDGKTELVPLAADDYTLSVTAEGFVDSIEYSVPIMQGITTLQNVNMFPYSEEEGEDNNVE